MPSNQRWPISYEQIRGHPLGLAIGALATSWSAGDFLLERGWHAFLHPAPIVFSLIYGVLAYWTWRVIDWVGWNTLGRY